VLIERCRVVPVWSVGMMLAVLVVPLSKVRAELAFEEGTYSCILCHPNVKAQFMRDIHFKRGMTCDTCHGGDPGNFEVEGAKAPATGYRGEISKMEGVKLCSSCHSNEEVMRQYGLSTDQYQKYTTSKHGKMLLTEGNKDVAACVDCHGVHLILPPSDPSSKVFRKNLPFTCGACHSDAEYMKPYTIPTNQLSDFLESVHGIDLIKNNNRAVPECARCHGVHGARAPGITEVYNVCGQCHLFIREQFMKSPHFEAEKKGIINGCEACHGNHKILRASTEIYTNVCRDCHAVDSEAYKTGMEIKVLIDDAWKKYEEGEAEVKRAVVEGLWVLDEEMMMEEAYTLLVNLRTSQHTINLKGVEGDATKAVSIINGVITTLEHNLVSIRIYKLVLIPIWIFITGMIALFFAELKKKGTGER